MLCDREKNSTIWSAVLDELNDQKRLFTDVVVVLRPLMLLLPLLPLLPLVLLAPSTVVPLHHVSSSFCPTPSAFAQSPLVSEPVEEPVQPVPIGGRGIPYAVV